MEIIKNFAFEVEFKIFQLKFSMNYYIHYENEGYQSKIVQSVTLVSFLPENLNKSVIIDFY